jgi:hypothetical protein
MSRTRALVIIIGLIGPVRSIQAAEPASKIAARIDKAVSDRLKEEKVLASPHCTDAEFLRRACLDITGVIPTAERARAFLDSKDADKRAKLIDELLASKEYGKRMADVWRGLLLTYPTEERRFQPEPFRDWLGDNFNANKPWDKLVRELLTANGDEGQNPAVSYFLSNETVDRVTDNVTKNLLGVQLQCAQCHNHPFMDWKQTEYWGMAAFFMKVKIDRVRKGMQKNPDTLVVGEEPVLTRNKKTLPDSAKFVPAKYLQGGEASLNAREPYRPVLANWITSPRNPYFAKAQVNRVWSMYFGRGLVNPVDDMHEGNPASHPALLNDLAASFVASGYDVKELVRAITLSQTYQRSSKPIKGNEEADTQLHARMAIKVLSGEMMYDSMVLIHGNPTDGTGRGPRNNYAGFFGIEDASDTTEYSHGIPQALRLMNSTQFSKTAVMNRATNGRRTPREVIEELFLITLARRPTSEEASKLLARVKKGEERNGYTDILWALLNCSEFALNR